MTREAALTQVRKLLNMTTNNGCTEAEAATAAGMAQKIMLKHDLAALDVDAPDEDDDGPIKTWEDPLDRMPGKLRQIWRGQLAQVLCRANGTQVFWSNDGKPTLKIIGRASSVMATRYMYDFCVREMERLAKQYRGNGRTWMNNWRHGAVSGIQRSIADAREAARQEYANETGTSLIVIDKALAVIDARLAETKNYMDRKYNMRSLAQANNGYNSSARATGQRDGGGINLGGGNAALGGGNKRLS
ncbi:MAG: hypothetical protein DRQ48_00300 [Gammaproteobacteria bacterium]|nr:MAG: hypothetical protein DRQ48_00300 [Gammaproteobacteria bacterium]